MGRPDGTPTKGKGGNDRDTLSDSRDRASFWEKETLGLATKLRKQLKIHFMLQSLFCAPTRLLLNVAEIGP